MNGYRKGRALAVILLCMALLKPLHVWAAEAFVAFGSNWYNGQEGEPFPVGVYIRGDAGIGEYHVTIQYDQQLMQYISGADEADQESGVLTLTGTGGQESIKYPGRRFSGNHGRFCPHGRGRRIYNLPAWRISRLYWRSCTGGGCPGGR